MSKQIHRRTVLKAAMAGAGLIGAGPLLSARPAKAAPEELTMLSWYGHAEPDAVAEFEEVNNVRIKKKYYVGGDQMLALLAQSPPGTYDVILTDREYVEQLVAADMIERLSPEDYPFDDFFPEFQKFPGHWMGDDLYSVMIRFGYLGLSYNTAVLTEKDAMSYVVMWDDKVKGRVGHFDWHLPNFGVVSQFDGNADPFDLSDDRWQAVQDRVFSLKPQVAGYFDYGGVLSSLRSGEVAAIPGIGDWITGVLQRDGATVATAIPEEGGLMWAESLSIGKGSRRPDLAQRFIQYMTSPAGQVRTAKLQAYPALLPTEGGWKALQASDPDEAARQGMVASGPNAMDLLRNGRIKPARLAGSPIARGVERRWSRYKNL